MNLLLKKQNKKQLFMCYSFMSHSLGIVAQSFLILSVSVHTSLNYCLIGACTLVCVLGVLSPRWF